MSHGDGGGGPRQVNMADIARAAGVSMATTSRALNDLPGVSPATGERVLSVARGARLRRLPGRVGALGRRPRRVAVVVPHLARWFFGEVVEGIESGSARRIWT